jgi:ABC-type sugar transport system ATPase subunit
VQQLGLATIYQEGSLAPNLTIVENIVLGREKVIAGIFLPRDHQRNDVEDVLQRVGLDVSPLTPVSSLSPASRQLVEIAKALYRGARVIIMDEPTAVLGVKESSRLVELVRTLSSNGVTIVYISHHLQETLEISDRVTVMRDGHAVLTSPADTQTPDSLVQAMIGRKINQVKPIASEAGELVFSARSLGQGRRFSDINIDLRAGEVVGITGLVGSGRSRLARVIFGAEKPDVGAMSFRGRPYSPSSPAEAIELGVGFVSEDRKAESLLQQMSIAHNLTMTRMPTTRFGGFIHFSREQKTVSWWIKRLKIRPALPKLTVGSLSGGNQQKVAIARSMHTRARLMIFDEPGQGVDMGAKEEILQTIRELAENGCAVLVVSSDLEELIQVANRVLVMRLGRIAGELSREEVSEKSVLRLAMGTSQSTNSSSELRVYDGK